MKSGSPRKAAKKLRLRDRLKSPQWPELDLSDSQTQDLAPLFDAMKRSNFFDVEKAWLQAAIDLIDDVSLTVGREQALECVRKHDPSPGVILALIYVAKDRGIASAGKSGSDARKAQYELAKQISRKKWTEWLAAGKPDNRSRFAAAKADEIAREAGLKKLDPKTIREDYLKK